MRKGQWSLLQHIGAAGDQITVLDETRQPVKDAVVWLDGRKLTPDAKTGNIIVPFTTQPGTKPIILAAADGTFATLTSFEHHTEEYRLDANIYVEREQVLARRQAVIAVRTALLLNDAQVSLDLIQNPKLVITSTSLDGVDTTQEVKIDKLDPTKVFTHPITVPERLDTLSVELTGQVEKISAGGQKQELTAGHSIAVNGIDKTERVIGLHLSRFEGEVRLRTVGPKRRTDSRSAGRLRVHAP